MIGSLSVPGDYTLFVNLANPAAWELIVNKQTGQSGLEYDAKQDLGRVKMTVSAPALVEQPGTRLRLRQHRHAETAWETSPPVNFTAAEGNLQKTTTIRACQTSCKA